MGARKPKSGKESSPPKGGLADALFTRTQQGVLGYLFGQPDRSFFAAELIRAVGMGSGSVQRELARLEATGLALSSMVGNQKHYRANPDSPIFNELASLAQKTFGIAGPIRSALAKLAPRINAAFVFGSVAKRSDTAHSDIDVMIISDDVDYGDVFAALEPAAQKLGRPINPTLQSTQKWGDQLREENAFHVRVMKQPKIWLIGSEPDVSA